MIWVIVISVSEEERERRAGTGTPIICSTKNYLMLLICSPIFFDIFFDPDTGRHYVFITNHFDWSAQTIADIYTQCWQVELFFKWIKQNFKKKIKTSIGNCKHAGLT